MNFPHLDIMLKPMFLAAVLGASISLQAADDYVPGPDSKPAAGVPSGKIETFAFTDSKVFPGTSRDGWVYIPAQ